MLFVASNKLIRRFCFVLASFLTFICLLNGCSNEATMQGDLFIPEVTAPSQPNYTTISIEKTVLTTSAVGSASIVFPFQESLYWEGNNARFISAEVSPKQEVKKGDILMTFDVDDNHINLVSAGLQLERLRKEFADGKASRQAEINAATQDALLLNSYDQQIAELTVEKLRAAYDSYVFTMSNNIASLENKIKDLEEAAANNVLVAPFDGVIDYVVRFNPGDPVTNNTALITIHATDIYEIHAKNASSSLLYNTPVNIVVDDKKTVTTYSGCVVAAPNILPSSVSQNTVLIRLDQTTNAEDISGSIHYNTEIQIVQNVFIAPRHAIHQEDGKSFVYLLENGTEQKRYVSVQPTGTENVWVLDGLSEGEILIID